MLTFRVSLKKLFVQPVEEGMRQYHSQTNQVAAIFRSEPFERFIGYSIGLLIAAIPLLTANQLLFPH